MRRTKEGCSSLKKKTFAGLSWSNFVMCHVLYFLGKKERKRKRFEHDAWRLSVLHFICCLVILYTVFIIVCFILKQKQHPWLYYLSQRSCWLCLPASCGGVHIQISHPPPVQKIPLRQKNTLPKSSRSITKKKPPRPARASKPFFKTSKCTQAQRRVVAIYFERASMARRSSYAAMRRSRVAISASRIHMRGS
jgi:hypothetical protein